ncbi:MAG: cobaltochelatase subunit CobN [Chitinophagales bacterium]|nr:cobaltochelatase subunit CobN [Chitinophagales bacterium]
MKLRSIQKNLFLKLKKKAFFKILSIILLVGLSGLVWKFWISPTKIALYNFSPHQVSNIALSNTDKFIKFTEVTTDEIEELKKYDFILGNGMGLKLNDDQYQMLGSITSKIPTHFIMAFTPKNEISSIYGKQLQEIEEYMDNGNRLNYQNFARYVRKNIDKKKLFVTKPGKPVTSKRDVFFHIDEKVAFDNISAYESYLKQKGLYIEGAKRIAMVAGIHDPYSGDKQFLDSTIIAFQNKGFNVYPFTSTFNRIQLLDEIKPDAVIYFPHGRLLISEPDKTIDWLKEKNIPLFTPLTINQTDEDWNKSKMGMFGGFMGQTIILPELDGALYPYVLFTQYKTKNGLYLLKAIPSRLKKFTEIVYNYVHLKSLDNKDKKIAIYYFKGLGANTLNAQGLEVTASLYNVLKRLKSEGYKIDHLPNSEKELEQLIFRQGNIFDSKADGAFQEYFDKGNSILIDAQKYDNWLKSSLSPQNYQAVINKYGKAPGHFMTGEKNGKEYIAVSGIQLGNITLLPQPAAALIEDEFKMTHGVNEVPPHSYLASYLWVQNEFKADALLHFGTHGSLEFTPGKQVALSEEDWPELLVGTLPHFYLYTIGNIGEAMMAKRRTYATTISYLTPAFVETDSRKYLNSLQSAIVSYFKAEESNKRSISLQIKRLAMELGIHRYLRLDSNSTIPYTTKEIEKIDNFAEEIAGEKINGEYYTLGIPYSNDKINSTVLAMSTDPIAYSLAALEKIKGSVTEQQLKNKRYFTEKFFTPSKDLVQKILNGQEVNESIVLTTAGISKAELDAAKKILEKPKIPIMDLSDDGDNKRKSKIPDFVKEKLLEKGYDVDKDFIPESVIDEFREVWKKIPKFVQKKIAEKYGTQEELIAAIHESNKGKTPKKDSIKVNALPKDTLPAISQQDKIKAKAILDIEHTIHQVSDYKKGLIESPELELKSLINGLNGGYISPSSGGDAVANPEGVPTGHNLYSINAENTPSESAWEIGKQLAQNTIDEYLEKHGKYPQKIAYTFWSSEFIETDGVSIAQALYMLGVEPVRDDFGRVFDIRVIPSKELQRPRIDIVIQTSGQFRDLAASRIFLLSKAIEEVALLKDDNFDNFVRNGTLETEKQLIHQGFTPKKARELSKKRVFGGLNGAYGTGIQEYIKSGDQWSDNADIAKVYINNMGATYDSDKDWGEFNEGLLKTALENTDVLIQPRQNNTWGALSLDHVYEFMGGLNTAIKEVTGKDPDAYLADYRNHRNMRMQELKEAIGTEAQSTIFNPTFIKEMMKGKASSASQIAEIVTNMYGWNSTRPEVIDHQMWDELYDTYIQDKYQLGINNFFQKENPAVIQTTTAVMLETARKGMWDATTQQLAVLAKKHLEVSKSIGSESSEFTIDNKKLQDFISKNLSQEDAKSYQANIRNAKQALDQQLKSSKKDAKVLKKESLSPKVEQQEVNFEKNGVLAIVLLLFSLVVFLLYRRRKANK